MSLGFLGIEWGVHHAEGFRSADEAMTAGRFMFAGCIDAPDNIPAGSWHSEWWPEISEYVPFQTEIQREGTL